MYLSYLLWSSEWNNYFIAKKDFKSVSKLFLIKIKEAQYVLYLKIYGVRTTAFFPRPTFLAR